MKRLALLEFFKKKRGVANNKTELKRRRTTIVQDGILVLSVASLLVFNAAARGVNLLMALGAFFVGFLAVDYFWGKRTLRNLDVVRKLPESVYAGEPFYVEIKLDATKRVSSSWAVVVEDVWEHEDPAFDAPRELKKEVAKEAEKKAEPDLSTLSRKEAKTAKKALKKANKANGKKNKKLTAKQASKTDAALREGVETLRPVVYFPTVRKFSTCSEYYVGVCTRRGVRRLKALTVSTRFPCGFFRSMKRFDASETMIVFPKIGRLSYAWDAFVAGRVAQEASVSTSLTSRIPDETVSIRDWRPGDSKRTIAWRATAKRDKLQSREFTKRQTRTVLLILDLWLDPNKKNRDANQRWKAVETAIAFAATLVEKYTEFGDSQLHFTLNGDTPITLDMDQPYDKLETNNDAPENWDTIVGGASTRHILTRLALAKPPKEDKLHETIHAARAFNMKDSQVFVVSAETVEPTRLGFEHWEDARFIDVSSPQFDTYFQLKQEEEESTV